MKYDILPKALYNHPSVKKNLYHNDSCTLYKILAESLLNQEKISTSHCVVFVVKGKLVTLEMKAERHLDKLIT